jgi:hypothetical protein
MLCLLAARSLGGFGVRRVSRGMRCYAMLNREVAPNYPTGSEGS